MLYTVVMALYQRGTFEGVVVACYKILVSLVGLVLKVPGIQCFKSNGNLPIRWVQPFPRILARGSQSVSVV